MVKCMLPAMQVEESDGAGEMRQAAMQRFGLDLEHCLRPDGRLARRLVAALRVLAAGADDLRHLCAGLADPLQARISLFILRPTPSTLDHRAQQAWSKVLHTFVRKICKAPAWWLPCACWPPAGSPAPCVHGRGCPAAGACIS